MPHTCAIKTCRYTTRHGDGRSMHKFPTVQALRVAWMSACGISPSFATQSSKICGSHFLRTDYGPSGHTLLDSAVPSQNLPAPMEEGVDRPSTPPPSSSGQTLTTATGSKMATNDPAEDELSIPRASMNKMIKEVLPKIRVANESRELILNCCKEFILLLSSEANAVCNEQNRRTINPDHVLIGLDKLGFNDYRQEVEEVARECKDITAKRRRQSTRLENLGIPEEELLRQQQELFARARHEQMLADQQQLQQLQADSEMHAAVQAAANSDDEDDYS